MQLILFNTLTKHKEVFLPLDPELIKMYVCGPTVYDYPHIGNARSVVVYDILYRILLQLFPLDAVLYVRNITDVDDKIIDRAKEQGILISELTMQTLEFFHHDMRYLKCLSPRAEPKATEHIAEMIDIIEKLISLRHAYIADNHVYFDINSAKDYTKLSGRVLEEMLTGVRIENSSAKKNAGDFVLWKPASLNDETSANFASPWGNGRPGWHIECSAMSHKYLGEDFDIHGGGVDLIFPHHTNEIAQSCSAFPGSGFAKYWVHNGFLTVEGEKMSKSLGNFVTVKDLTDKEIPGEVIRLFLMSNHYHKPLDYNGKAIEDATKMLNYWYRAIVSLEPEENYALVPRKEKDLPKEFFAALLDDMNTPLAIKIANDYAKMTHAATDNITKQIYAKQLLKCARFIGLMTISAQEWFGKNASNTQIEELVLERVIAKKDKNWALADQIRSQLREQGIILEDRPDGTTSWKKEKPNLF